MAEFYAVHGGRATPLIDSHGRGGRAARRPAGSCGGTVLTAIADGTAIHWSARPEGGLCERMRDDLDGVLDGWRRHARKHPARPEHPQGVKDMHPLEGQVALVTGGTRGAGRGMAVELGAAGATVYVTGRTTETSRSPLNRPETIEETARLVSEAGGHGIPVRCDHMVPAEVAAVVRRIEEEQDGRLDVLVDDTWGGDQWVEWKPLWEHDLDKGLRALRNGLETHLDHPAHRASADGTAGRAGWSSRSPTGTTCSTSATGARCSSTWSRPRSRGSGRCSRTSWSRTGSRRSRSRRGSCVPRRCWSISGSPRRPGATGSRKDRWFAISESPRYIGRAVVALAEDPDVARWSGTALSSGSLARHYGFTDLDGSRPEASRFFADAYFGDQKDAEVGDYRYHRPPGYGRALRVRRPRRAGGRSRTARRRPPRRR